MPSHHLLSILVLFLLLHLATSQTATPTPLRQVRRRCQNQCMRNRFRVRQACRRITCRIVACRNRRTNRQGFRCARRNERPNASTPIPIPTPTPTSMLPSPDATPDLTPEPTITPDMEVPRVDDILLCTSRNRLLLAVRATMDDASGQIISAPIVFRSYLRRQRSRRDVEVECLRSGRRGFTERDAITLAAVSEDDACRPQAGCVVEGSRCQCDGVPICSINALNLAIDRKC